MLDAAFSIEGDLVTMELITDIFGRLPHKAYIKGETGTLNATWERANQYTYSLPAIDGHFGTEGISTRLVELGTEVAERLGRLSSSLGARVTLSIWQDIDDLEDHGL